MKTINKHEREEAENIGSKVEREVSASVVFNRLKQPVSADVVPTLDHWDVTAPINTTFVMPGEVSHRTDPVPFTNFEGFRRIPTRQGIPCAPSNIPLRGLVGLVRFMMFPYSLSASAVPYVVSPPPWVFRAKRLLREETTQSPAYSTSFFAHPSEMRFVRVPLLVTTRHGSKKLLSSRLAFQH